MKGLKFYLSILILLLITTSLFALNRAAWYKMVNNFRAKEGLHALTVDSTVETLAYAYTLLCYSHRDISHNYLTGEKFKNIVYRVHAEKYTYFGEVLQEGIISLLGVSYTVMGFMNSPHHREILMDPKGVSIGMAYLWDPIGRTYYMTAYVAR